MNEDEKDIEQTKETTDREQKISSLLIYQNIPVLIVVKPTLPFCALTMCEGKRVMTLQIWFRRVCQLKASWLKLKKQRFDVLTVILYARMSSSSRIAGKG